MASGRVLCSHLVDIWTLEREGKPQKAVLEEMDALHAAFAAESAYAVGARIIVETGSGGPVIKASVSSVRRRPNDCLVEIRFQDGYRWRSEDWSPDHAVATPQRSDAATAS